MQFALLGGSLLLSLLIAEFAWRGILVGKYRQVVSTYAYPLYKLHPESPLAYSLTPGAAQEMRLYGETRPSWNYRINELGFRGRVLGPRRGDVKRIIVLGDSYTFGWAMSESPSTTSSTTRAFCSWGCQPGSKISLLAR